MRKSKKELMVFRFPPGLTHYELSNIHLLLSRQFRGTKYIPVVIRPDMDVFSIDDKMQLVQITKEVNINEFNSKTT
jgi:hypothetical protein